jgi:hypothetical protein
MAARSLRLPDAFRSLSRSLPPVALHWLPAQRALRSVQHGSPTGTVNSFFRLPPVLPAPKHCTVARMHYLRGTCRSTGRKRLMFRDVAQLSARSNGSPSAVRSRSSRSVPLCCSLPCESVPSLPLSLPRPSLLLGGCRPEQATRVSDPPGAYRSLRAGLGACIPDRLSHPRRVRRPRGLQLFGAALRDEHHQWDHRADVTRLSSASNLMPPIVCWGPYHKHKRTFPGAGRTADRNGGRHVSRSRVMRTAGWGATDPLSHV